MSNVLRHSSGILFTQAYFSLKAVRDAHTVLSNDELRQKYNERGYAALGSRYSKYSVIGRYLPDSNVSSQKCCRIWPVLTAPQRITPEIFGLSNILSNLP